MRSHQNCGAFTPFFKKLGIAKASFLSTNNDFELGAAKEFSEAAKREGIEIGVMETMDPKATDFSAQLAKIKAAGGDTLFVTTAVEQITLLLKQARDQQLTQRMITTGGSSSPDQLIDQAGEAANGSYHIVFFTPWFPEAAKYPDVAMPPQSDAAIWGNSVPVSHPTALGLILCSVSRCRSAPIRPLDNVPPPSAMPI